MDPVILPDRDDTVQVQFPTYADAEQWLNDTYGNQTIELTTYKAFERKPEVFQVDRISVEQLLGATNVIIISKEPKRYVVSKDEFFDNIKIL